MGTPADRAIVVSGYLGAGKSHLAMRLRGAGLKDVIEADALEDPSAVAPGSALILTVLDGANLPACLDDPEIAPLLRGQIARADALFISRSDVADVSAAAGKLDNGEASRLLAAASDEDLVALLRALEPSPKDGSGDVMGNRDYVHWSYRGAAVLTGEALDRFLADRSKGAYRISGQVRGSSQGTEVQVFGRGRQTAPVAQPDETILTATGLASRFRPADMDLAFSGAVVAASYGRGIIACR